MAFTRLLICFGLLLLQKAAFANTPAGIIYITSDSTFEFTALDTLSAAEFVISEDSRPNPLLHAFRKKQTKNKKVVAAILAFPFPFGIVGLHRIYLGCAPYVPVAYIASLGGIFGILPFVDFCVILLDKDMDHYINNKKVFMWVH